MTGPEENTGAPLLRVLDAHATDEEIAAIVAVVSSLAAVAGPAQPQRPSAWADPARRLRTPVHPSPGGWRASAFPR